MELPAAKLTPITGGQDDEFATQTTRTSREISYSDDSDSDGFYSGDKYGRTPLSSATISFHNVFKFLRRVDAPSTLGFRHKTASPIASRWISRDDYRPGYCPSAICAAGVSELAGRAEEEKAEEFDRLDVTGLFLSSLPLYRYIDLHTSAQQTSNTPKTSTRRHPMRQHHTLDTDKLPPLYTLETHSHQQQPHQQQQQQQQQQDPPLQQQQQQKSLKQGTEYPQGYQAQFQISALFQAFCALALLSLRFQYLSTQQYSSPNLYEPYLQWSPSPAASSTRLQLV